MSIFKPFIVLSVCAILLGCNSEQLPIDTRILIAPQSKSFTINSEFEEGMFCFKEGGLYQDVPLLISVTDGQNAPIGDAEVGVYADFTANTSSAIDMLELYSDNNGNGVIDGPEELVSSATSGVFKTKTDKYHGTAMLMLRMYMTCPYSGEVFAFVGASTYSMQVKVTWGGGESTDGGESDSGESDSGDTDGGGTDAGASDGVGAVDGGTDDGDADNDLSGGVPTALSALAKTGIQMDGGNPGE